jgi:hypothetical protein
VSRGEIVVAVSLGLMLAVSFTGLYNALENYEAQAAQAPAPYIIKIEYVPPPCTQQAKEPKP